MGLNQSVALLALVLVSAITFNRDKTVYLWDVMRIKGALSRGKFKPNCAVVIIELFERHGVITEENEMKYLEIVQRLHRRSPVATSAWERRNSVE